MSLNFQTTPVPHAEAARSIRDKSPVTRAIFDQLPEELQARAFLVTGIESTDILQSLRDRIADLPEGADWDEVKKDLVTQLTPWLGQEESQTRATLLLRHHGFSAYAAAQARHMDAMSDIFPFRQYISTEDAKVRPSHAALNGIILPANHPFWEKHTPPWEWGCRCDVVELTEEDMDEEKSRDENRPPENRRVLEGPALRQLETESLLNRGPNKIVNVQTPKERGGNYENNVRNYDLPYEEIATRWNTATREAFEGWAASVPLQTQSLLESLTGKLGIPSPKSSMPTADPETSAIGPNPPGEKAANA